MARTRDSGEAGVKVTIQLHNRRAGVEIVISLPTACAWNGRLLDLVQRFVTDNTGKVVAWLPPSDEITPLSPRGQVPVLYKLQCNSVGILSFAVPNALEWTLGTEPPEEPEEPE